MAIDVAAVRADTPGCASTIHLNNAGSSLPPAVVVETVIEYLQAEARIGGYELASDRATDLAGVYVAASELVGGRPENWAFVESATRAWNAAFSALRFEPGDRILTTTAEYPSNMGGLLRARELDGVEIVVVPDDDTGQVDVGALASLLDDRTRLVSITHVPTQGGLVNPAEAIGAVLRDHPALYQLDACQSVGQFRVRIDEIGCDILSFTGRKFVRGPRGTGMVWASDAALDRMGNPAGVDMQGSTWDDPLTITPLATASRFEPYEVFFAGKVGLAAALRYADQIGIDDIADRNTQLARRLRVGLAAVPGVELHDRGDDPCALVTFTVEGHHPEAVQRRLRDRAINVSRSSATSARLDFPARGLDEVVRASVHYFNDDDDVDALIDGVSELARPG
jgi:cysteine desulfurase/selenocysteine lyase